MKNSKPLAALCLTTLGVIALAGCPSNSSNPTIPSRPSAPTNTPVPSATATNTPTNTATATITATPTSTGTSTASGTPTLTATDSPTGTPTLTATQTATASPTFTPTDTTTATPSVTPSFTPTSTPTDTTTLTATSTITETPTSTPSSTATAVYPFLRYIGTSQVSSPYYMALAGSSSTTLFASNGSTAQTIDSFVGTDASGYGSDIPVSVGGTYAQGMAVDPSGTHLYILNNNGSNYMEKYSLPLGGAPTTWALPGTAAPNGLAVDASYLYLSDNSGKVFKYTTAGVSITSWTGYYIPEGVAVDTVNNVLYVGDIGYNTVIKSNLDGTGQSTFASISRPEGVAVDGSQNVFVVATNNQVVYKYDSSGTLLCTIGSSATLNFPTGLIVSPAGYLYVVDAINNQIVEFAPY